MARFGHSLPKEKLGGIGVPSWLPDWLTGKDVREIQGPVYIPPRGKAGGYRKELAADIARKASKDPFTQRNIYSGVQAGADFIPLVGEDVGVRETAEDIKAGNYRAAALGGLGTVLGTVPVVGDMAATGLKGLAKGLREAAEHLPKVEKTAAAVVDPVAPKGLGIRGYHGSPHSFEPEPDYPLGRFKDEKIGTGEGAQAYGHGHYIAESESVARSYRDTLSGRQKWGELGRSVDELLPIMGADTEKLQGIMRPYVTQDLDRMLDTLDEAGGGLDAAKAIVAQKYEPQFQDAIAQKLVDIHAAKQGSMYEVNIDADPEAFLDWDKPLSEQSETVRKGLGFSTLSKDQLHDEATQLFQRYGSFPQMPPEAQARIGQLQDMLDKTPPDISGADYYRGATDDLGSLMSQMRGAPQGEQSKALLEKGIPGIRYLDQGSRGVGEGSRNYVVFDPKLISIVKKYGLAAAIASGVISEEMGRQMQEQGEL